MSLHSHAAVFMSAGEVVLNTSDENPLSQLPAAFLERLYTIVPSGQLASVLDGFVRPAPVSFRVNTLKASTDAVLHALSKEGIETHAISWLDDCFLIDPRQRTSLTHSPLFDNGDIYVQNLSSIFTARQLQAQSGEEILDLAAAPGGKTLVLAEAMLNEGRIAAVEPVKSRFFRLKNNIELQGVTIVDCYLKDGRQVGRQVPERFDRVLLDAPCSSESRFHVDTPETYRYWSEKKVKEMQRKQKQLLHSALEALKPGGTLVYSTCSFSPEENEAVVDRQLRRWGDALDVISLELPFRNYQQGLTVWGKKQFDSRMTRAVRILPSNEMEGFFLCKLQKKYKP